MQVEVDGRVYDTDNVKITFDNGRVVEIDPQNTTIFDSEDDPEPITTDNEDLYGQGG